MLLRWGRLLGTIGRGGSIGQGRMHCCKDSRKSNHGKDKAKQVTSPLTDNSMTTPTRQMLSALCTASHLPVWARRKCDPCHKMRRLKMLGHRSGFAGDPQRMGADTKSQDDVRSGGGPWYRSAMLPR
jgi:hypothetical protein